MNDNKNIYFSKVFILVLIAKIIYSFFFASFYLRDYFTPFINWFVLSGFKNPWEHFYQIEKLMFPYPTLMLWIMSIPRILFSNFLPGDWHPVTNLHLFVMRIPLLMFDILLFNLFIKLFPTKKEVLLYVYWCSPIIFLINYVHGQFDIIPTAIFSLSIFLLINKRYFYSSIFLALSAATKSHIFVALPFIILFLYKRKVSLIKIFSFLVLFILIYLTFLAPYLNSRAFIEMVLNNSEQKGFYEFTLPLASKVNLVLCPTAIFMLFLKFTSYKKLNNEIFLMFLGLVFAVPIIFVTPMPGRVLWSLPFIIYFYISNKECSKVPFLFYNIIYVIYFLIFSKDNPLNLHLKIRHPELINDLSISLLIASISIIVVWMYQIGIKRNEELKIKEKPLLIGIAGDSSTGKHTTFKILEKLLGKDSCVPVFGDNFHKWERGSENWKVFTHLNPLSNKLHKELDTAIALKGGNEIEIGEYAHSQGKFKNPILVEPNKFILFTGLHPFYLQSMRELLDIKIFMDADEELRQYWKIKRDVEERGYEKSQVVEQINSRLEDGKKFIKPQKDFADLIIKFTALTKIDLENLQSKAVPIKTTYVLGNSINLEGLLNNLTKIDTLMIEYSNLCNLTHQQLDIEGFISSQEIANIAYNLELNFDELLISEPVWLDNHAGVTELIFMLIYNHKMKAK